MMIFNQFLRGSCAYEAGEDPPLQVLWRAECPILPREALVAWRTRLNKESGVVQEEPQQQFI
jgi:hypothetical protein